MKFVFEVKRGIVTTAVVLALVVGAGVARAQNTVIQLAHTPPASAAAGQDLSLVVHVTTACTVGCFPPAVRAFYAGGTKSVTAYGNAVPSQNVVVIIPGVDVKRPAITYRFYAWQESCPPNPHDYCLYFDADTNDYTVSVP